MRAPGEAAHLRTGRQKPVDRARRGVPSVEAKAAYGAFARDRAQCDSTRLLRLMVRMLALGKTSTAHQEVPGCRMHNVAISVNFLKGGHHSQVGFAGSLPRPASQKEDRIGFGCAAQRFYDCQPDFNLATCPFFTIFKDGIDATVRSHPQW